MKEKKIKCLLVEPYELPKEVIIDNTLKEKQRMVGGYIESVYLLDDPDVVLICNEAGQMNGMKLNRYIGYDIIAGPFLIVGDDIENGGFKSLTKEQIIKYKMKFDKNSIVLTENKINEILLNKNKNYREER